jgi:hypothetical protein
MKRSSVVYAIVVMGLLAACGGDDKDGDTGKKNNSQQKAGSGGDDKGGVGCGSKVCKVPDGVMGEACCKDNFSSTCGIKTSSAGQCRELPKIDERCPVPDIMVRMGPPGMTTAYGCCTSNNECGIDFGSGCQPRTIACMVVGPDQKDKIMHQTCDGDELPLPADCGMNSIRIPPIPGGAAGGGS